MKRWRHTLIAASMLIASISLGACTDAADDDNTNPDIASVAETTSPPETTTPPEIAQPEPVEDPPSTDPPVPDEPEEEDQEEESEPDSGGVDWTSALGGIWLVDETFGGQTQWVFNAGMQSVTWTYWPQGVGFTNPLNNGRNAPINSAIYFVEGDTLTVQGFTGYTRVYSGLTADGACFSAYFENEGQTVRFCPA